MNGTRWRQMPWLRQPGLPPLQSLGSSVVAHVSVWACAERGGGVRRAAPCQPAWICREQQSGQWEDAPPHRLPPAGPRWGAPNSGCGVGRPGLLEPWTGGPTDPQQLPRTHGLLARRLSGRAPSLAYLGHRGPLCRPPCAHCQPRSPSMAHQQPPTSCTQLNWKHRFAVVRRGGLLTSGPAWPTSPG